MSAAVGLKSGQFNRNRNFVVSYKGLTKKCTSNIEHRTLNVQHRIMYSINLKPEHCHLKPSLSDNMFSEQTRQAPNIYPFECGIRLCKNSKEKIKTLRL
jgi:hypothetical protein